MQAAASAKDAVPHLERVIALDPEQSAYVLLAARYQELGKKADAARVAAAYEQRFGEVLPTR